MPKRSRAEILYERLLRDLASGQWLPGTTLPPTRQLEQQLGASHVTMLNALHMAGDDGLLDIRPRRPIVVADRAATIAGERLSDLTKRVAVRRLAVLIPEEFSSWRDVPFFTELLHAIEFRARAHGMDSEVLLWPLLDQVSFARGLSERGFGAAFAASVRSEYLASLQMMRQQRLPVVLMNATIPELALPSVTMDEYGGARRMAEHLAGAGHRNMCMVTQAFDRRLRQRQHRVYGWLDHLTKSGLEESCSAPICYLTNNDDVVREVDRLLNLSRPPTALLFAYGLLFEKFMAGARGRSIRVPQDISLATFDPVSAIVHPPAGPAVTTISADMDRAAECVLEMIGKLLAGQASVPSIRIPMQMYLTDSIGPPRA